MVATFSRPSYGLNTAGLRKTTSSASSATAASTSPASTAARKACAGIPGAYGPGTAVGVRSGTEQRRGHRAVTPNVTVTAPSRRRRAQRLAHAVEHPLLALADPNGVEAHEAALLRGVRRRPRGVEQPRPD